MARLHIFHCSMCGRRFETVGTYADSVAQRINHARECTGREPIND